jgi:hypothetical protein
MLDQDERSYHIEDMTGFSFSPEKSIDVVNAQ